ncbi:MAG: hypothetical protein DYG83_01665 [Candidatus Brocadia sp. AMX2]|nr:MAG: hypothetical protein EDM70_01070 [Candidatus Brocadia sp. AMX2]MBC6930858.1 hypothetical protein [Candidatus Brocadia sp.]MBL1167827.1 hypothetical protein [Candidatus Brocadia sp. AMX1]MCE7865533.1 hypothetical protein [Candidatus Brocadia sp. AMX2]MCQ3915781.1 hypothetical protein [Candidatus Brocadia sp.]
MKVIVRRKERKENNAKHKESLKSCLSQTRTPCNLCDPCGVLNGTNATILLQNRIISLSEALVNYTTFR